MVTAQERGWERLANGRLLAAAQGEFDVLLTVDRGMRYEQPTHTFGIGLVVVRVKGNHVRFFEPLLDEIRAAIRKSAPGRVTLGRAERIGAFFPQASGARVAAVRASRRYPWHSERARGVKGA